MLKRLNANSKLILYRFNKEYEYTYINIYKYIQYIDTEDVFLNVWLFQPWRRCTKAIMQTQSAQNGRTVCARGNCLQLFAFAIAAIAAPLYNSCKTQKSHDLQCKSYLENTLQKIQ